LSFGATADLGHKLREHIKQNVSIIILGFSRLPFMDTSSSGAVNTIITDAMKSSKLAYIAGMHDKARNTLKNMSANNSLAADTYFDDCLKALYLAELTIQVKQDQQINRPLPQSAFDQKA